MENLTEAFWLLIVGIVMVLIVLWLVIGIGNLVIHLTNRYLPEEKKGNGGEMSGKRGINRKKLAAIVAAVEVLTHGQGSVSSIQKK